tara:strand:+ start:1158 stop:1547 length:390 start_codon:yes stop_codon:yes gene_type:complete
MDEKFTVEIISPDRSIYKEEVSEVIIPSYEGELGILKDHIPLITFLRPGLIKIVSDNEKKFFVEDGTVEFVENNLLILSSTVKYLKDLDKNSIEDLINDVEKKLKNSDVTDKEIYLLNHKLETLKNINL